MVYRDKDKERAYQRTYKARKRAADPKANNTYQANYKRNRYASDIVYREGILARNKNHRRTASYLITGAKKRAKLLNVPFNLVLEDVQLRVCELSELPFQYGEGTRSPYSPSLDRVKPELGYVKGNVRVVLWALNAAMGNWGLETIRAIVHAVDKSYTKL